MIADDRPMLPLPENGVWLYRTYHDLGIAPGQAYPTWQVALIEWWRFVGRRRAIAALRQRRLAAVRRRRARISAQKS